MHEFNHLQKVYAAHNGFQLEGYEFKSDLLGFRTCLAIIDKGMMEDRSNAVEFVWVEFDQIDEYYYVEEAAA